MFWLVDSYEAIRDFMGLGGPVLKAIAVTIFVMWVLILERLLYFRSQMKSMSAQIHDSWEARPERRSWTCRRTGHAPIVALPKSSLWCLKILVHRSRRKMPSFQK